MPLTPQDVSNKVFGPTRFRRGYDETEVDSFLDQVETELTRLTTENASLRAQLEQARVPAPASAATTARPALGSAAASEFVVDAADETSTALAVPGAAEGGIELVTRTLVLAQRTADEALREARAEAEQARAAARAEADAIVSKAQREVADTLGDAERNKTRLQTELDSLRSFEQEYRTRLRAYLQMQLAELETGGSPVGSLAGADSLADAELADAQKVSLPGGAEPPATVRLPSDIGTVPSSLFRPAPTLVGAGNGSRAGTEEPPQSE